MISTDLITLMDKERVELLIAAAIGAFLGIATGYATDWGTEWFRILIWALIGAVVVSGAVYCYRAFR
jgi:uncharacterized membrane protein YeaQ/YmgE (transglycosylase-associated protein family)